MGKMCGWPIVVALLWGAGSPVYGIATEDFGNGPVAMRFRPGVLKLVNRASRVYWFEVNGNPWFFFNGSIADLNDAIALFAALPYPKKEIVLLAGPAQRASLTGERVVAYNWSLHVPEGDMGDARAALEVRITQPQPDKVDAARIMRLLKQLDDPHFRVREAARRELTPLARSAEPILRQALTGHPSLEVRSQIRRLLDQLQGVSVKQLRIPGRMPVIDATDLKTRYQKGLTSPDAAARGRAAMALAQLPPGTDVLDPLRKTLKMETNEYAQRCFASAFAGLGARARPALPELEKYRTHADKRVAQAFAQAVQIIRDAKPKPLSREERDREQIIRQEIRAFCQQRA